MFFFQHKLSTLENNISDRRRDLRWIIRCGFYELSHGFIMFIIDFNAVHQCLIGDFLSGYSFNLFFNSCVFCNQEIHACFHFSVLRMNKTDIRHLRNRPLPVLTCTDQRITHTWNKHCTQAVKFSAKSHFQIRCHDRTCKCRKILFHQLRFLMTCPHTDREITCSMYQWLRCVNRETSDSSFACFFFIILYNFFGILNNNG